MCKFAFYKQRPPVQQSRYCVRAELNGLKILRLMGSSRLVTLYTELSVQCSVVCALGGGNISAC